MLHKTEDIIQIRKNYTNKFQDDSSEVGRNLKKEYIIKAEISGLLQFSSIY